MGGWGAIGRRGRCMHASRVVQGVRGVSAPAHIGQRCVRPVLAKATMRSSPSVGLRDVSGCCPACLPACRAGPGQRGMARAVFACNRMRWEGPSTPDDMHCFDRSAPSACRPGQRGTARKNPLEASSWCWWATSTSECLPWVVASMRFVAMGTAICIRWHALGRLFASGGTRCPGGELLVGDVYQLVLLNPKPLDTRACQPVVASVQSDALGRAIASGGTHWAEPLHQLARIAHGQLLAGVVALPLGRGCRRP